MFLGRIKPRKTKYNSTQISLPAVHEPTMKIRNDDRRPNVQNAISLTNEIKPSKFNLFTANDD